MELYQFLTRLNDEGVIMKNKSIIIIVAIVLFMLCCVTVVVVAGFAFLRSSPVNSQIFDNLGNPLDSRNDLPVIVSTIETGTSQSIFVDELRINMMESFPLQVSVTVIGNLPDGCTSIVSSESEMVNSSTFELKIMTDRPADQMCTMALVPFEETITLDVAGLPAGTYTVEGFGLKNTFTFDVDN